MRFVRLIVNAFQGIEFADVEFGPGLNVFYGPNDHGKSTLARALRAALLLPATSSEAECFSPWQQDQAPKVQLVFADQKDCIWRVSKSFGDSPSAELEFSKDGRTYTHDCKGRQVEDRLRTFLSWGIPSPGGKGGPRGLPQSFLAQALLAEQTDVRAILDQGLDDDPDGSGKIRLTKALEGLAQDPVFKKVIDQAQQEFDRYFTSTGQKKRGKTSPFAEVASDIKKITDRLEVLDKQQDDSKSAEEAVSRLRVRWAEVADACEGGRCRLDLARQAHARALALDAATSHLNEAIRCVQKIDDEQAKVSEKTRELETLVVTRAKCEDALNRAKIAQDSATVAFRTAEEEHRASTSEDTVRDREVRLAQLDKELAELENREHAAETLRDAAAAAILAIKEAKDALAAQSLASTAVMEVSERRKQALHERDDAEKKLQSATGIIAFGRWRMAVNAANAAKAAREEATTLRAQAEQSEHASREIERDAGLRKIPDGDVVRVLAELERQRDLAEASLGGGLAINVHPRRALAFAVTIDGSKIQRAKSAEPLAAEAVRSVDLTIEDLVDIRIVAGDVERRREVEVLHARWTLEGMPVLDAAGVKNSTELTRARGELDDLLRQAAGLRAESRTRRERAAAAELRAAELEARGANASDRERALGGFDLSTLEEEFALLGNDWEPGAERLEAQQRGALKKATDDAAAAATAAATANANLTHTAEEAARAVAARELAIAAIDGEDAPIALEGAQKKLRELANTRSSLELARSTLEIQRSSQISTAEGKVAVARTALDSAVRGREVAEAAFIDARTAVARVEGELATLCLVTTALDRSGAEEARKTRETEVADIKGSGPLATEDDVGRAEGELRTLQGDVEAVTRELHEADGALKHVGGSVLRDELAELREARDRALERQRELEVDAQAWQLLRDMLRESENAEGAHLGRALAAPVTERFVELTGQRYRGIAIGPTLKTQGVLVAGASSPEGVLDALSVGTREQLATLLRIAIAEHLHSAIVLDDQLVQTDTERFSWFRKTLKSAATRAQIVVLTCHAEDYVAPDELPTSGMTSRNSAAGAVRAVDLGRVIQRSASR